jgi:hypothetical protein
VLPLVRGTHSAQALQLTAGDSTVQVTIESNCPLRIGVEPRPWHPSFGVEVPAQRLCWEWDGRLPLEVVSVFTAERGE